jgi:riboflavin kinase/FMN adenylyltransferase
MELIRGLHNLKPGHRGCVATIGNYDGLHLGHREVLAGLVARAGPAEPSLVMCFEPTPREFFHREEAPARLSSFREKYRQFAACGVDRFLCLKFDRSIAEMSPEDFIRELLVEGVGVRHLVVGDDFRFGRNRAGDFATLEEAGRSFGFEVVDTPSFEIDGLRVSSTAVRQALAEGRLEEARGMLGRRYAMNGRVVAGRQLGRTLGFPTANIRLGHRLPPLRGVFAVRVGGLGERRDAVANFGTRPTVQGRELLLEVHIFDFDADIYGRRIEVEFVERLRGEKKFDGVEAMTEQVRRDAARAREILASID